MRLNAKAANVLPQLFICNNVTTMIKLDLNANIYHIIYLYIWQYNLQLMHCSATMGMLSQNPSFYSIISVIGST